MPGWEAIERPLFGFLLVVVLRVGFVAEVEQSNHPESQKNQIHDFVLLVVLRQRWSEERAGRMHAINPYSKTSYIRHCPRLQVQNSVTKTINLETQRKRRKRRFFGIVTLAQPFSSPARLPLSSRQYPQKPLLPPLPLRFKVYGFDFCFGAKIIRKSGTISFLCFTHPFLRP